MRGWERNSHDRSFRLGARAYCRADAPGRDAIQFPGQDLHARGFGAAGRHWPPEAAAANDSLSGEAMPLAPVAADTRNNCLASVRCGSRRAAGAAKSRADKRKSRMLKRA
jgi:hypothetical protein